MIKVAISKSYKKQKAQQIKPKRSRKKIKDKDRNKLENSYAIEKPASNLSIFVKMLN